MFQKTVVSTPSGIGEVYIDRGPRIVRNPLTGRRVRGHRGHSSHTGFMSMPGEDIARLDERLAYLLGVSDGTIPVRRG